MNGGLKAEDCCGSEPLIVGSNHQRPSEVQSEHEYR
jgi:hypothetical protein